MIGRDGINVSRGRYYVYGSIYRIFLESVRVVSLGVKVGRRKRCWVLKFGRFILVFWVVDCFLFVTFSLYIMENRKLFLRGGCILRRGFYRNRFFFVFVSLY